MTEKEKIQAIIAEIERRMECNRAENPLSAAAYIEDEDILAFIGSLSECGKEHCLRIMEDKDKPSFMCDCGEIVSGNMAPYAYDRENNDVYFATICPNCGKLSLFKE